MSIPTRSSLHTDIRISLLACLVQCASFARVLLYALEAEVQLLARTTWSMSIRSCEFFLSLRHLERQMNLFSSSFYRVGGGNRISGFLLAAATVVLLFIGTGPISFIRTSPSLCLRLK
jgi:hypothetical protein